MAGFTFSAAFALWIVLKLAMGIRVSREEELRGLDIGEHGMEAYAGFQNVHQHLRRGHGEVPMKLIIAYIQPHRLNDVKQELYRREIYRISVTNALGCGQQKGYHESWRGADEEVNLLKKVRLEIAVNDAYVAPTIEGIVAGPAPAR